VFGFELNSPPPWPCPLDLSVCLRSAVPRAGRGARARCAWTAERAAKRTAAIWHIAHAEV